jgi:putative transposase
MNDLFIYRRNLPHWRLEGSVYFVTWRLHTEQPELSPDERDVIVSALRHFDNERYVNLAFVVMNDHVHVLLEPLGTIRLQDILHSWKSFTARKLQKHFGRRGPIWQPESFDRIIRDEAEFVEKAQYILNNPLKRWPDLKHYKWVSPVEQASLPATQEKLGGEQAQRPAPLK